MKLNTTKNPVQLSFKVIILPTSGRNCSMSGIGVRMVDEHSNQGRRQRGFEGLRPKEGPLSE